MKQSVFSIPGMDCPSEEAVIRNRLKQVTGISELRFNLFERELTVVHNLIDETALNRSLQSLNLGAILKNEAGERITKANAAWSSREVSLLAGSGALALLSEVVAWSSGNETSIVVLVLSLLSIALGGSETLAKGIQAVRSHTLNINFLMTIAITGAFLIGQYPEAAMVTFLFGLAETIEKYSLDRARNAIRTLMELAPEVATVKDETGQWKEVPVEQVREGATVRIRPGERVPLDGTVLIGSSSINQAPITGESIPVAKEVGDQVFAGTINENGSLEFQVKGEKGNTTLDRIVKTIQAAQAEKATSERFVETFARYYTPVIVALAVLVALVPPLLFGEPFSVWIYKALVLLVIACPCALVISTPVTVVSGLAGAAKRGILVKGGRYLEEGRKLRAIALDKTGTLTLGKPAVTDIVSFDDSGKDELLKIAASVDALSEHPVASAIVGAWTGAGSIPPEAKGEERPEAVTGLRDLYPVTDFASITGRGVKGRVNGLIYFVGNHRLAEENKVCGPHVEEVLERLEREGKTAVVVTSDVKALGIIAVADTLRETSIEAVSKLHLLGIRTVVLTGDNDLTAKAIAQKVGIDDARGNLLPEDKVTAITALLGDYRSVGMVGDGINDAPALAKSSIGFAMGAAGTDTALETADVALMEDDLRKLPEFIELSHRAGRKLTQNIVFSIGVKAVFFVLAIFGVATLWMAVFADVGASLIVVVNGMSLLRTKKGSER